MMSWPGSTGLSAGGERYGPRPSADPPVKPGVTESGDWNGRMLDIKDLKVEVDGKRIIDGLSLSIGAGEVHAIMGPNGSGKSTLAFVLAGREGYEVVGGSAAILGEDLLAMKPEERAASGFFLAMQYPVEIPGVANMYFLRQAMNAVRKARGQDDILAADFMRSLRDKAKVVGVKDDLLKRDLNAGFSGGEKKRNEILQLAMLEPRMAVLDETDSGLDIDALRTVAEGVNRLRSPERGMIVITHYQRLLDYIVPDKVHVMAQGRIERSGGKELAQELERTGYGGGAGAQAAAVPAGGWRGAGGGLTRWRWRDGRRSRSRPSPRRSARPVPGCRAAGPSRRCAGRPSSAS